MDPCFYCCCCCCSCGGGGGIAGTLEVFYRISGPRNTLLNDSINAAVLADFATAFERLLGVEDVAIRVRVVHPPPSANDAEPLLSQALLAASINSSTLITPEVFVMRVKDERFTQDLVAELIAVSKQGFTDKHFDIARAYSNGTAAEATVAIFRGIRAFSPCLHASLLGMANHTCKSCLQK